MEALFPLDGLPHFPQMPLKDFGHLIKKPIITNGGYDRQTAEAVLQKPRSRLGFFREFVFS
jgi:N-ethylmaleimide reductase